MKNLFTGILLFLLVNCDSSSGDDTKSPPPQGSSKYIYVSDAGTFSPPYKIIRYNLDGTNPKTFINSNLAWPQDIVFLDSQNVVLISNLNTGNIVKFNATTGAFIGVFASGLNGPTRMKIHSDTLLYVLQWNSDYKVRRFKLDGTDLGDFTSVGVNSSIGIDWDSNGNLYVSSFYEASVRKFDPNGNDLGLFISANLIGPTNIWFDSSGDLLVNDYNGGAVKRFSSSGDFQEAFIPSVVNTEGVAIMENGDILIGVGQTHSVKQYSSAGVYKKDLIKNGSGGLVTPNAVVIH